MQNIQQNEETPTIGQSTTCRCSQWLMCVLRISHISNQQFVIREDSGNSVELCQWHIHIQFSANCRSSSGTWAYEAKCHWYHIPFLRPLGSSRTHNIQIKDVLSGTTVCQSKAEWDEELSSELKKKWEHLVLDLENIESTLISRCYQAGIEEKVLSYSLQGFCDASLKAYGAIVYLKMTAFWERL